MNTRSNQAVFTIDQLSRKFLTPDGAIQVLRGLTCQIGNGITAILGYSGSGKTTLLNLLAGLDSPTSGEVHLRGKRVPYGAAGTMLDYCRRVSVIWQANNLISHLTCVDNAALPLVCQGVGRREAREAAAHFLNQMGLSEKVRCHPHTLSGGQKQRVGIARAFASRSEVILADEPTGNLDEKSAHMVMEAFWKLAQETDTPSVVVTHNRPLAEQYCGRVLELHEGVIDEQSDAEMASPCTAGGGGIVSQVFRPFNRSVNRTGR